MDARLRFGGGVLPERITTGVLALIEHLAIADDVLSVLMGDDVEARRTWIQRNAKDARFLDV